MAKEYKTFVFDDNTKGRNDMANTIETMADDGWKLHSKEVTDQGFDFVKTCCLGCIFSPLVLFGQKNRKITLIMERDYKGPKKPATNNETVASSMNEIKKTSTNKSNKTVLIILISIVAVIFLLFLIGISTGISNTSQKSTTGTNTSKTENTTSTLAISESDAEKACQDASPTVRYATANNVNIIDVWNYNKKYIDKGDGTANLRWNGVDKDSKSIVFFNCDVSKDSDKITATRLTVVVDNIEEVIID